MAPATSRSPDIILCLDPPVRDLGINFLYAAYESLKDYCNRKHEQNKESEKTGNDEPDESHRGYRSDWKSERYEAKTGTKLALGPTSRCKCH